MSSFIWFQCFVLIWLFYVIILLLESPVKNAKERLSKTQKTDKVTSDCLSVRDTIKSHGH